MTSPPLACTVRDCGLLLERRGPTLQCARGHSYDVSRAGYVNLLQPQDRKSLAAGDAREALEARARLLAAGVGRSIVEGIVDRAACVLEQDAVVADLGSGSGDVLAALAGRHPITGIGIDLSTPAAELAARRFPSLTWVVANADRGIPLLDRTADLILSLHGRRHPEDCARVLTAQGCLLVAVPAPDDLIELRAAALGQPVARDRTDALIAEHQPHFSVAERFTLRERHTLGWNALQDLLAGTYRGKRHAAARTMAHVESLDVTLASDVVVFKPRRT